MEAFNGDLRPAVDKLKNELSDKDDEQNLPPINQGRQRSVKIDGNIK